MCRGRGVGFSKEHLLVQLNGNPTLFKDWLTQIKLGSYDTMLNHGYDCGVCFFEHT